jgi:hypothetical protein
MPPSVRKHKEILKKLHKSKAAERKKILRGADCGLVKCLCSIAHNTLNGVIRLHPAQRTKLKKHRHILRKLAKNNQRWEHKKKLFTQSGGAFLPLLLAPLIAGIFGKFFN